MLKHIAEHLAGVTDCKDPDCYGIKGKIPAAKYSVIGEQRQTRQHIFRDRKLADLNTGSIIAYCRKETASKDELAGKTLAAQIVKELRINWLPQ